MNNENVEVLKIKLHDHTVGYLAGYQGGRNVFVFDEGYRNNSDRPTFTLTTHPDFPNSTKLLDEVWVKNQRLHPVFSNLLPEGALRQWLAQTLKTHIDNEFPLLAQLGIDLPGALEALPVDNPGSIPDYVFEHRASVTPIVVTQLKKEQRFSLAGEQIKFSMKKHDGRYHINQQGELGAWIVKTPSTQHKFVPLNEYTSMTLAGLVDVDIPDIKLVNMKDIDDLPPINLPDENLAYAIRRFDRGEHNRRIHSEDFSQVFFKYPHDKYRSANYEQIARVLYQYSGKPLIGVQQMARRLLVNILLANGDAHLKNWSLIYRDGITPELAPSYDIVSTKQYIKNEDKFALNLGGSKSWYEVNFSHFNAWANHADIPWRAIKPQLLDVLEKARTFWPVALSQGNATEEYKNTLNEHWKLLHKDLRL